MKFSLSGNAPFGCISTGTQFREINLLFDIVILSKDFLKKEWQVPDLIPAILLQSSTLYPRAKSITMKLE